MDDPKPLTTLRLQAHDAYLHLNETTRQLDLSFPLTTNHFVGNNNRVRLKCLARYQFNGHFKALQKARACSFLK